MNKNNTMKKIVFLSMITSALVLSGCSSYKKPVPTGNIATNTLVDQKMIELGTSIENSLNTLVKIERGDAPKKNLVNPIGTTIAGRPESKPLMPIKVEEKVADGKSTASVALLEQRLDTKVNITWTNDDADKLLENLAKKIDFRFEKTGSGAPIKVTVKAKNDTVKSVLGVVASQMEGRADIKVHLPSKTIKMIYR